MFASMHASASQCQLNVDSQVTVRSCRYGSTRRRKKAKSLPLTLHHTLMSASLSMRQTYICFECRSIPQLYSVVVL